jgi:hypothetical protein
MNSFESNFLIGEKLHAGGYQQNGLRWQLCCEITGTRILTPIGPAVRPLRARLRRTGRICRVLRGFDYPVLFTVFGISVIIPFQREESTPARLQRQTTAFTMACLDVQPTPLCALQLSASPGAWSPRTNGLS